MLGMLQDVTLLYCPHPGLQFPSARPSLRVCPIKDGILIGLPRQLVQLLQLLPQSAHRADGGGVVGRQRCLEEEGVRQRQPPGSPTEQGPYPLLVRRKAGDQRCSPKFQSFSTVGGTGSSYVWQAAASSMAPKASQSGLSV